MSSWMVFAWRTPGPTSMFISPTPRGRMMADRHLTGRDAAVRAVLDLGGKLVVTGTDNWTLGRTARMSV
jgi:hypothetical protein